MQNAEKEPFIEKSALVTGVTRW